MIECPNCFNAFKGLKCSCGYMPRNTPTFSSERRTNPETALTEHSQQQLELMGIHKPGMTRSEKTRANLAYIKKLQTLPKPEPRAWAYGIIADADAGVVIDPYVVACAREVTGIQREEIREAA